MTRLEYKQWEMRERMAGRKISRTRRSAPIDLGRACEIAAKVVAERPERNLAFEYALREAAKRLAGQCVTYELSAPAHNTRSDECRTPLT